MVYVTTAPPTAADLRSWLEIAARDDVADELIDLAVSVATEEQSQRCEILSYSPALFYACLRRAGRVLAAKSAPLGRTDLGELGQPAILRWDAEIDAAEAPYRRGGFA